MASIADVFASHELDLSEGEFAAELASSLARDPVPDRVSDRMLADLEVSGGLDHPERLRGWSEHDDAALRVAVHSTMLADLLAATLSTSQAARLLGISESRLSHRAREIPLLTSKVGRHRRYYRWQFVDGHVLPGLGIVTDRLTGQEHPLNVAAVMSSPAEELDGRTPVEHLATGGNPVLVADLVEGLIR